MSTIWAFDNIEKKHILYHEHTLYHTLREHATNVINFEKKKMLPLTKEELKSHQDANVCCICGKRILKVY